ncbi:MAG TPA: 30S ribosomal protein S9 [Rhabdochlamydiaceae bacterium]
MRKATTSTTKATAKQPKVVAPAAAPKKKKVSVPPLAHGVGRRKKAIARVWLRRGRGTIIVNGKDFKDYFDTDLARIAASMPFQVLSLNTYDVEANVIGGGKPGQADAVKLGISRALVSSDESYRRVLREHGLLTVDSRVKERKKYGQKAARRKFQFVKR